LRGYGTLGQASRNIKSNPGFLRKPLKNAAHQKCPFRKLHDRGISKNIGEDEKKIPKNGETFRKIIIFPLY